MLFLGFFCPEREFFSPLRNPCGWSWECLEGRLDAGMIVVSPGSGNAGIPAEIPNVWIPPPLSPLTHALNHVDFCWEFFPGALGFRGSFRMLLGFWRGGEEVPNLPLLPCCKSALSPRSRIPQALDRAPSGINPQETQRRSRRFPRIRSRSTDFGNSGSRKGGGEEIPCRNEPGAIPRLPSPAGLGILGMWS